MPGFSCLGMITRLSFPCEGPPVLALLSMCVLFCCCIFMLSTGSTRAQDKNEGHIQHRTGSRDIAPLNGAGAARRSFFTRGAVRKETNRARGNKKSEQRSFPFSRYSRTPCSVSSVGYRLRFPTIYLDHISADKCFA